MRHCRTNSLGKKEAEEQQQQQFPIHSLQTCASGNSYGENRHRVLHRNKQTQKHLLRRMMIIISSSQWEEPKCNYRFARGSFQNHFCGTKSAGKKRKDTKPGLALQLNGSDFTTASPRKHLQCATQQLHNNLKAFLCKEPDDII